MSGVSSYTPFLIGQGTSKTGLFQYLESWVAPEDAFIDIQDGYVNRGQIWKRDGQTILGRMQYCECIVIGYGNGGTGPFTFNISTATPLRGHLPIVAGSIEIKVRLTTGVTETYTDDGLGGLTGSSGGNGTVVSYDDGQISITPIVNTSSNRGIMMRYEYIPTTQTTTARQYQMFSVVAIGTGVQTAMGTFAKKLPIIPGTMATPAVFVIAKQSNGVETYSDDGTGALSGSLGGTGSINYTTGDWAIDAGGGNTITSGAPIELGFTPVTNTQAIMGINQWNDEVNNTFTVTVQDTRRMCTIGPTGTISTVCDVAETLFIIPDVSSVAASLDNASTGYLATFQLISPLSIYIEVINPTNGVVQQTLRDNGAGTINSVSGAGILSAGKVDYYSGQFTFTAAVGAYEDFAVNATFTLQNDYFFGNNSNFFNWTNWFYPTNRIPIALAVTDGSDVVTPTQYHEGFLYLTNNVDPVTLFNGSTLSRPAFAIQQEVLGRGKNQITKCLDVKTYSQRLLFVRPSTTLNNSLAEPQSIRWSAQRQPTNFVADIPGSGGELSAATSDWIQSSKFLKDFIVVSMQYSTWNFRATGNAFNPFTFFKIDSTKSTLAPYGSIEFDYQVTSMGTKGLIATDGVSLERYDEKVFDLYDNINVERFGQCFGLRFDALNQSWMLYPDSENDSSVSSQIFIHNYKEDSWSIYNMPLSVVGFGFGLRDLRWSDLTIAWSDANFTWNQYLVQKESLRLLGGDHNGLILQLNNGIDDNGTPILMEFTTKRLNPFVSEGRKTDFGYLDIYYTANDNVTLNVEFILDNDKGPSVTREVTLTSSNDADYAWQRIYINVQSQFIQWKLKDKPNPVDGTTSGYRILGMLLWASAAGRLIR